MKTLKSLQLLAGLGLVAVISAGCVHERVTYVTQVPPAPQPPPPETQPPPAPAPIIRSAAELDHMLGPIALYPDPLTAQILPAATAPDQVAAADRYLREGRDVLQVEYQPWDPSIKALTRYPDVLRMMAGNLPWTSDLGIAFVNQERDVMDSIQRLRLQAQAIGNLRTTPEQVVIVENRVVQIVPANPQIIYVPVYRPEIVFIRPPPPGGFHIVFGAGRPIGPWLNQDVNWRDREVIVWQRDHPRPHDWWYQPPSRHERSVVVNNTTVVNNYTVWQPPRNRPVVASRDGDRTPAPVVGNPQRPTPTPRPQPQPSERRDAAVTHVPTNNPSRPVSRAATERKKQVPNHNAATNASVAHPGSTPARVNPALADRRPAPPEATPVPQAPGRQTSSVPLSVETHRDPVPRPTSAPQRERANPAQVKANSPGHTAANDASEQSERKAEKGKAKGQAKGQAKKASEHGTNSVSGTNTVHEPR
jgi:hypothetical protein